MKLFKIFLPLALLVLIGFGIPLRLAAQNTTKGESSIETCAGEIVLIDTEVGRIVVKTTDKKVLTMDVPKLAKIFKGSERIDFSALEKNDEVTIKYIRDNSGHFEVMRMIVEDAQEKRK